MVFKVQYEVLGGHTHCSLFSARQINTTFAKCGEFCIHNEEFPELRIAMSGVHFKEKENGSNTEI